MAQRRLCHVDGIQGGQHDCMAGGLNDFYILILLVPLIGPFEVVEPQGVGQIQPDWAIEEFVEFDVRQSSLKVQHHQCKSIPN